MFPKQAANSLVTETSQYFVFFCRYVCSAILAKCLIINVLRLILVILFFIAFLNITYAACHTFAIGDSIWGVVIGFYDTNASEEYFKECIDSWRNTELDGYDFSILNTHQEVINQSNIMRMQSVKYETRPILIWQFSMLLSPETGKACIVSLYSTTEKIENLVNDLMASVRFK